jgi:TRAP-type transport system small permease protein
MRYIRLAFDWIFAALTWFALALLIAMTVILFSDVFCRYVLRFSIAWADEIVLVLLIWFVFIALAIGVRKKIHMSIDFLTFFLPKKFLDGIAERFVDFLTFCFGGVLIYFGIELIKIGSYSALASINLPSSLCAADGDRHPIAGPPTNDYSVGITISGGCIMDMAPFILRA